MAGGGGGGEDLNLVPYLDVMVNLIMFMITVTAYIVELKEAPVLPPAVGGPSAGSSSDDQPAFASVNVTTSAFVILDSKDRFVSSIAKEGDSYPFVKLTTALRQYRDQFEVGDNLVLAADPTVPYSVVVATMDAARTDQKGNPLFPGVTLAVALAQ